MNETSIEIEDLAMQILIATGSGSGNGFPDDKAREAFLMAEAFISRRNNRRAKEAANESES